MICGFVHRIAGLMVWKLAQVHQGRAHPCKLHDRCLATLHLRSHSALPPNSHVVGRRCCHHQVAGEARASGRRMGTKQHTALCSGLSLHCPSCAARWGRWAALQPALSSLYADCKPCPLSSIILPAP